MWSQSAAMKRHLNSNSLTFSRPKTRAHCQANKTGQQRFSSLKSRLFVPYSCPCPIPVPIPIPFPFPFRFPSDRHLSFFGDWGALVVGSVSVSKSKLDKRRERTIMPYSIFTGLSWSVKMNLNWTKKDDGDGRSKSVCRPYDRWCRKYAWSELNEIDKCLDK